MKHPHHLFSILVLLLLCYQSLALISFAKTKKLYLLLKKTSVIVVLFFFSYIWFVPIQIGWNQELPVCKFRFQVFEYDTHDYSGHGDFNDLFFKMKPEKYGMIDFYKKVGGWQEYVGFKPIGNIIDEE